MSPFASCGHVATHTLGSYGPTPLIATTLPLEVSTDSHERTQLRSVTSGLAGTVGLDERVDDVVAPIVAYTQVVAQQTFAAEPELLNQLA
jgi:hypothetical protein